MTDEQVSAYAEKNNITYIMYKITSEGIIFVDDEEIFISFEKMK